jgi:Na+/H+ antiporter NhaD/arsenite permease-like protein
MKKLLDKHDDRLFFAGIIVIAANAGGAWSPIGDVTTTMLWIGGQITTLAIMKGVFLASIVNMVVPLAITSWFLKGKEVIAPVKVEGPKPPPSSRTSCLPWESASWSAFRSSRP